MELFEKTSKVLSSFLCELCGKMIFARGLLYHLFFFIPFFSGLFAAFAVRALVPFIEHGWSAVFPAFAPRIVHMMAAVTHSAEEDHLHEAEEEEQEEDGAADGAEWEEPKVMAAVHLIAGAVTVAMTVHHRRDGGDLSAFGGFGNRCGNCGGL